MVGRGTKMLRMIAVLWVMVLLAAACGSSDAEDSGTADAADPAVDDAGTDESADAEPADAESADAEPADAEPAPAEVAIVIHFTAIDYFKRFTAGAEDGAAAAGGVVDVIGTPQPDPPAQLQMFTDLASTDPDAVGVIASPPDFWVRPLEDAAADGLPLLATVEPPAEGSTTLTTFVGDNGFQTGATLAQEIVGRIDDPTRAGTLVIGTGDPAIETFVDRIAGMRSVFDVALPNAEVVIQTVGFEPVANLSTWQDLFRTHGDDALAFVADGEHSGANLAQVAAELPGDYAVGLVDMDVLTAEGIRDGFIDAAVGGVPYLRGYLTGRLLVESVNAGGAIPGGWLDVCCEVITQANAEAALARLTDDDLMRQHYQPVMDELFADLDSVPFKPLAEVYEELPPSNEPNPWLGPIDG